MNQRRGIHDIKSQNVRGLVRGLLDRKAGIAETTANFRRLLGSASIVDLETVDDVLRGDPLFRHVQLVPEFPEADPFKGGAGASLVPEGRLAMPYVGWRVSRNAERIADALRLLSALNVAILGNDNGIAELVELVIERHGHSLALARKAAVVVGYAPKDVQAYPARLDLVSTYGVNSRNYGMMATIDSIGTEFNYLDLKHRFQSFATLDRAASLPRKISQLCFTPLVGSDDGLPTLLAAYYEVSLVDAAIALLAHRDEGN